MRNTLSCRFWLILALDVTVNLALTALRAEAQEKGRINSSLSILAGDRCLTQGLNLQRNVSNVGKTILAECSCMHFNTRLCTVWKLLNKTSHLKSHIKVFTKFNKGFIGRARPAAATGTCQDYTRTINKLYGSDQELSYSTAQKAKDYSIDWSFCDDMHLKNGIGCNYTIQVPTNFQNSSGVQEKIHYCVPSFTNASQHLQVGKMYQLDIEKCQLTAVSEIAIKNGSLSTLLFPVKTRPQLDVTMSTTPECRRKRSGGMFLSGNDVLYTAPLAALLLGMF